MPGSSPSNFAAIPSVAEVLDSEVGRSCLDQFGHEQTVVTARNEIDRLRDQLRHGAMPGLARDTALSHVSDRCRDVLQEAARPLMRRVFNLTGTVLHTNLGRASYAEAAVEAATTAMRHPLALEFDLETGRRGQRDDAVQRLVAEITGAEDACIVNNNASAVLLVLSALAANKETIVSRGELIEIGGSFRMPDIMAGAGTRLREVGTTNRTHLKDYRSAFGPETALFMKVHTSNYKVMGFTKEVSCAELSVLAREVDVPLVDDLGSGVLVDLSQYGLRNERTVQQALADGADLVTFSGDKLLGGPQAGFIAGKRELVRKCASHPLKRALRLDKVRLAALEATLKLYRDPSRLGETLPTIQYFARSQAELRVVAARVLPALQQALAGVADIEVVASSAQVGSGALPLDTIPSVAIRIPAPGKLANDIALGLRHLPIPVIGRIEDGAVLLDLRCLDDEAEFVDQLLLPGAFGGFASSQNSGSS